MPADSTTFYLTPAALHLPPPHLHRITVHHCLRSLLVAPTGFRSRSRSCLLRFYSQLPYTYNNNAFSPACACVHVLSSAVSAAHFCCCRFCAPLPHSVLLPFHLPCCTTCRFSGLIRAVPFADAHLTAAHLLLPARAYTFLPYRSANVLCGLDSLPGLPPATAAVPVRTVGFYRFCHLTTCFRYLLRRAHGLPPVRAAVLCASHLTRLDFGFCYNRSATATACHRAAALPARLHTLVFCRSWFCRLHWVRLRSAPLPQL